MSSLNKNAITATIISTLLASPVFSQETTRKNPIDKSLSAGVGFPATSEPIKTHLGLGIGAFPDYEGSNDYSAKAFPLLDIEKPGVFFIKGASINTNDGVASAGLTLFHLSYSGKTQLLIGPIIRAYSGRDEADNDILSGMGNINSSAGMGIFMKLNSGSWIFNLATSPQDVGNDNDGLLVTLDASYNTSINNNLKLSSGLSASWADDDYMQSYFGITGKQSSNTGLTQFDSKAGIKDIGINFKTAYILSKNWILNGQIGYWHLSANAADSPLVDKKGTKDQVRGLVGLSYQF